MTTAADPKNYPAARGKRSSGAAIEELSSFTPPRMRVFPWSFTVLTLTRQGFSFPMVRGPALIKDILWASDTAGDPPHVTLEIGRASIPVRDSQLPLGSARAWEVLTELQDPYDTIDPRAGNGFPITTLVNWTVRPVIPLDLILGPGEHHVVLAATNYGGANYQLKGHIRVLEAINPEALSFFL